MTTPSVETINSRGSGRQPAQRDAEEVEKSLQDDAQNIPRVDLDPFSTCRANIPSIVQRSIMLIIFKEHVLGSEGDRWHLLLHQMTLGAWSPVIVGRDCRCLCQKGF